MRGDLSRLNFASLFSFARLRFACGFSFFALRGERKMRERAKPEERENEGGRSPSRGVKYENARI